MIHVNARNKGQNRLRIRLLSAAAVFALLFSLLPGVLAEETVPPEETVIQETAPKETVPEESAPEQTQPEETAPEETVPEETNPEETAPEETVPEETNPEETTPEETVPEEIRNIVFFYPDRTESVPVDQGKSFRSMYPGIDPATLEAEKENHSFLGWFESADGGQTLAAQPFDFDAPVTEDLALYPGFRLNSYTVTYIADGQILAVLTVDHGTDAQAPELPQKEGFTAAWDLDGRNITADTQITAVYTRTGSGVFQAVAGEGNFGGGWLSENAGSLAAAIPLTEQEQLALEAGTDVSVRLVLQDRTGSAPGEDRAALEAGLGEMTLGLILDASLFKQVGEAPEESVSTLLDSVTVSFLVPQALRPQEGTARIFGVLRVHDGVTETVDTAYNPQTGVLSFSSDRFSTFALIYADTQEAPPAFTPDTSDGFQPIFWLGCLLAAALGAGVLIWRQKELFL